MLLLIWDSDSLKPQAKTSQFHQITISIHIIFLKYLGKDIGSSFPLNPNYFIFKQLIEYLNIYLVEAMPYMPCISLVFFFLGNNCYHSGSMQPLNLPEFLEVCDKAPKCRAMTLRPARMDLTRAAKQPLFCPRPSASSAVLSPSLCAFHAAPSLSAAECHPRPLPVRFIKPVGDEVKAWRQLFSPASLFQTRDLVHRLQDGATLYGASDISGCLPHSSSSRPRNYTDENPLRSVSLLEGWPGQEGNSTS